jgi:hypothetical protein
MFPLSQPGHCNALPLYNGCEVLSTGWKEFLPYLIFKKISYPSAHGNNSKTSPEYHIGITRVFLSKNLVKCTNSHDICFIVILHAYYLFFNTFFILF